jgi:hypothetical protein
LDDPSAVFNGQGAKKDIKKQAWEAHTKNYNVLESEQRKKIDIRKNKKQSTARIPKWSPTLVLTDRHMA